MVAFVSDLAIFLLPQRVIFGLQISRSRKLGLSALFIIGGFACVSSGIRISIHFKLLRDRSDVTYLMAKICFWSTTQVLAGFLVSCLPAGRMMAKHVHKQPWASRVESTLRSLLQLSRSESHRPRETPTRGNLPKHNMSVKVVTDVEFEELIQTRDNMSISTV